MARDPRRPMMGRPLSEIRRRRLAVEGGAGEARAAARAPKAPRRAGRAVGSFARNPARHLNEQPVTGALLLWALILALQLWRRGSLPDAQGVLAITAVTAGVVIVAAIAPEPVTLALVLVLIIAAARSADAIRGLLERVTGSFAQAVGPPPAAYAGGGGYLEP